jgi:1,4-alpha-glucan branching enzyme
MSETLPFSLLTAHHSHLFNECSHFRHYDKLGARIFNAGETSRSYFAVWAPNGEQVSLIGDFPGWNRASHPLKAKGPSGAWETFIPGVGNLGGLESEPVAQHGRLGSLVLALPPLSVSFFSSNS